MVKEIKFFRKKAEQAERTARTISDIEASESPLNLAHAYRSQSTALIEDLRPVAL